MIAAEFRHAQPGSCCCEPKGKGLAQACSDELDGAPGGEPCLCSCHSAIEPVVAALLAGQETPRIVLVGGPRRGKSTIARALREERGIPTLCGDPRSKVKDPEEGVEYAPGDLDWSENSQYIAEAWLLCRPGPWCIEGVAVARALRKVLAAGKGEALAGVPIVFIPNPAPDAGPTEGQERMAKAVTTVWQEVAASLPFAVVCPWVFGRLTRMGETLP